MKPTRKQIESLIRMTLNTRPEEITCDEWVHLVGRYAELVFADEPVPSELRPVAEHLEVCPECAEELEALRRALC